MLHQSYQLVGGARWLPVQLTGERGLLQVTMSVPLLICSLLHSNKLLYSMTFEKPYCELPSSRVQPRLNQGAGMTSGTSTFFIKFAHSRAWPSPVEGIQKRYKSEKSHQGPLEASNQLKIRQKSSKEYEQQGAGKGRKQQHFWQRKNTSGSGTKAHELVKIVLPLSNVKEEIYGALDECVAFEEGFPVVAVRKALKILNDKEQWQRIIQVSKWMLSKGQGQTLGTYDIMLKAYDMDARLEEAEELWEKLLTLHTRSMPRNMFVRMMNMYKRREMPEKLLEVYKQMEKLGIKPDEGTLNRIKEVYLQMGMPEKQEELLRKYPATWKYFQFNGKTIRVPARQAEKFSKTGNDPDSLGKSHGANSQKNVDEYEDFTNLIIDTM